TKKRDYYEVLDIARNAAEEEIKRAYRKLAVKFHPDKNPDDPHAEEKFKELGEAYDVLMDPNKRAAYDRFGHAAFAQGGAGFGGGFHDPFDIFREVFGQGGFGGGIFETFFGGDAQAEDRQHGSDLRYDMQIKLEEAAFGAEKEIEIAKLVSVAARQATSMSLFISRSTKSFNAMAIIFIAKCQSLFRLRLWAARSTCRHWKVKRI